MGNWKFVLNIADKSIEATFSPSELPDIYEGMMGKYKVDKKRCVDMQDAEGKK